MGGLCTKKKINYITIKPKVGRSMDFLGIMNNISLLDVILNNKELNSMFESYLKSTFQYEQLDFFKNVENAQHITDVEKRDEKLKKIYEKFIKKNSDNEINISDYMQKQINVNKTKMKNYIKARDVIIGLMATNCLPRFIEQLKDVPDILTRVTKPKYIMASPHEWVLTVIPVAESLPICVTIGDYERNNKLIYVNQQFAHITGYTQIYSLDRNCNFLQGANTEKESITKMKNAFLERKQVQVKITNYKRNGDLFVNFLYLKPIYMTNRRKVVRFYMGFQVDINEHNIEIVDKVVNTFPEYIYDHD